MLTLLTRRQIDANAWNTCVAVSAQCIVYGYTWYLDAATSTPEWKWVGLVELDENNTYQAVMPVPLRRKRVAGVTYAWVIHQPFFCQILAIFSRNDTFDPTPFFQFLYQEFRYCSVIAIRQKPFGFGTVLPSATHMLDLSPGYETLYRGYSFDRRRNLRLALSADWQIIDSIAIEPLLRLFQEYHAETIPGSVADWAYVLLRNVVRELQQRGLAMLRYAIHNGRIEAGALFVQEGNRIIYLFNAASAIGRRNNARTLLIDQMIREQAGKPILFDFESPEKPSIRAFYRSFGAAEESFWTLRWSRLTVVERMLLRIRRMIL